MAETTVWRAAPWVVALADDALHARKFIPNWGDGLALAERVEAGADPRREFGMLAMRLPWESVRSVEWIPSLRLALAKRHWMREPVRVRFEDAAEGERYWEALRRRLPHAGEPTEARAGWHDVPLDPRTILGVLLAGGGLLALAAGAFEGAGNGPLFGPAARLRGVMIAGAALGPAAVAALGALVGLAGIAALVVARRRRPAKWVVRPAPPEALVAKAPPAP